MKALRFRTLIICLLMSASFGFTTDLKENPTPDSRIIEAFGQKHVDFLLKNNPGLISYYNFYLEKVWKIVDVPTDKVKKQPLLKLKPEFAKIKSQKFNILLYDVQRHFENNSYYNFNGKLLVLLSEKEFIGMYNDYRNSNK